MTDAQIIEDLWNKWKDETFVDKEGNENKLHELMGPDQFYAMATGKMKAWYSPLLEAGELFFKTPIEDIKDLTGRLLQVVGWISPEQVHRYEKLMEYQHKVLLSETVNDNLQKIVARTAENLGESGAAVASMITPGGALFKIPKTVGEAARIMPKALFTLGVTSEALESIRHLYNDFSRHEWNKAWDDVSNLVFAFAGSYFGIKQAEKAALKNMSAFQKFKTLGYTTLWTTTLQSSPDLYKVFTGSENFTQDALPNILSNFFFNTTIIGAAAWSHGAFSKYKSTPKPKAPPSVEPQTPITPEEPPSPTGETPPAPEPTIKVPSMDLVPVHQSLAPIPQYNAEDGVIIDVPSMDLVPAEKRYQSLAPIPHEVQQYIKEKFGDSAMRDFDDMLNATPNPIPSTEKFLDRPMADVTINIHPADIPLVAKATTEIEEPEKTVEELLKEVEAPLGEIPEEPPPPELKKEIESEIGKVEEEYSPNQKLRMYKEQLRKFEEEGEIPEEFYELLGKEDPKEFTAEDLDLIRRELGERIDILEKPLKPFLKKLEAAEQKQEEEETSRRRKKKVRAVKDDVSITAVQQEEPTKKKKKTKPKLSAKEKSKLNEITNKVLTENKEAPKNLNEKQATAFWGMLDDIQNAWRKGDPAVPLVFREPILTEKYGLEPGEIEDVFRTMSQVIDKHKAGDWIRDIERSGNEIYGVFKFFPNQPAKFMFGIDPTDVWRWMKRSYRLITSYPSRLRDVTRYETSTISKALVDLFPSFWSATAESIKPILRKVNGQIESMRSNAVFRLAWAAAIFEKYDESAKRALGSYMEDPNPTWEKHSYAMRLMQQNSMLKHAVEIVKKVGDEIYQAENKEGIVYEREDAYLPHLYEEFSKAERYFSNPAWAKKISKPWFMKTRTFATLEEAAKAGLTPLSWNPAVLTVIRHDAHLAVMRRQMLVNSLLQNGLIFKDPKPTGKAEEGEVQKWQTKKIEAIRTKAEQAGYRLFRINGKDYWVMPNPSLLSALDILGLDAEKRAARNSSNLRKLAKNFIHAAQTAKLFDLKFKFANPLPHALHVTFANIPHHIATEMLKVKSLADIPAALIKGLKNAANTIKVGLHDESLEKVFKAMRGDDVEGWGPEHARIHDILVRSGIKLEDPDIWPRPEDYIGTDGKFNEGKYQKDISAQVWQKYPDLKKELNNLVPKSVQAKILMEEYLDKVFFITRAIFKAYIPRMKAYSILHYVENMEELDPLFWDKVKSNPMSRESQMFRQHAEHVERTFGEMNYRNLLTPEMLRTLAVASHVSWGWRITQYAMSPLGVLHSFLKYKIHQKEAAEWIARRLQGEEIFKGGKTKQELAKRREELTKEYSDLLSVEGEEWKYKSIMFMTYVGLATILGSAVSQLARSMIGLPGPEDGEEYLKDIAFPVIGKTADGKPIRAKPLWFMKDYVPEAIAGLEGGPLGVLSEMATQEIHSLNPVASGIWYMAQNADYFGNEIYNPYSPAMEKTKQFFSWFAENFFMPMSVEQELAGHGGTLPERVEKMMTDFPGSYTRFLAGGRAKRMEDSHDETMIKEALYRYKHSIKPRRDDEARYQAMKIAEEEGPDQAQEWLIEHWEDFELDPQEFGRLMKLVREPQEKRLGEMFRTLDPQVQIGVFRKLKNQDQWWPYLSKKTRQILLEQENQKKALAGTPQ